MYENIRTVLKAEGAISILRKEEFQRGLKFMLIDFFCKDDRFKSLLVAYNEVDVYVGERLLSLPFSGKQSPILSLAQYIREGVKIYKDFDDYKSNRQKFLDEKYIESIFQNYEQDISEKLYTCSTTNFKVDSVFVSWYPSTSIITHYKFKGRALRPIVWNKGQTTVVDSFILKSYDSEFKTFIDNLSKELGKVIINSNS